MGTGRTGRRALGGVATLVLGVAGLEGCGLVIGFDKYELVDGPRPGTGDGGDGGTGGTGGSSQTAGSLRLAQMSPDWIGIDFCVFGSNGSTRPSGYSPAGVTFPGVGPYVTFSAGTYLIGVISAGMDCTAPLLSFMDFNLAAGAYHTVIVDGMQANSSLSVSTNEDLTTPAPGNIYLTVCHENSGVGPVKIGTVDAADTFTSLLSELGTTVTFHYQYCVSHEVAPISVGATIAISPDGMNIWRRWLWPIDPATSTSTSLFIYGTDATDIGTYLCDNQSDICAPLIPLN